MWAHNTHPDWLTAGTGAGQISWAVTRWSGSWRGGCRHNELHYELSTCLVTLDPYSAPIMSDSVCRRGRVHTMEDRLSTWTRTEGTVCCLPFNWNRPPLKLWSISIKGSAHHNYKINTFSHLPAMISGRVDTVVLVFFAQVWRYPSEISAPTATQRRVKFQICGSEKRYSVLVFPDNPWNVLSTFLIGTSFYKKI